MLSIMLASLYVLANNCVVSDYFPCLLFLAEMTSRIPSFVKRSTKYEDLFGEASGSRAPVTTPPISQAPASSMEQKRTSSGSHKRESSRAAAAGTPDDARSGKRLKLEAARNSPTSSSSPKTQLFHRMVES